MASTVPIRRRAAPFFGGGGYCGNLGAERPGPALRPGQPGGLNTSQFNKPVGYESDSLTNNEIGIKTEWWDHRLIVNLSAYQMKWGNIQLPLFDPVHLGNTTFDINGPSYKVKGFEMQFDGAPHRGPLAPGLKLGEQPGTDQCAVPAEQSRHGRQSDADRPVHHWSRECHTPIRTACSAHGRRSRRRGCSTAGALRLDCGDIQAVRLGWCQPHRSRRATSRRASRTATTPDQTDPTTTLLRYEIPGYTTYDAALGVAKDNWTAQITGSNLGNEYGPTNISSGQFIKSEIPLRPRVLMAQFSWKF